MTRTSPKKISSARAMRDQSQAQEKFPKPRTPLARKMLELRREYIAEGGRLLSLDEINSELARRRGGLASKR
jgi:hypothetical protein